MTNLESFDFFFRRPTGRWSYTISGQNENHFRYAEFFLGYTTSRETEMQKAWVRERTLHRKKILQHRNSLKKLLFRDDAATMFRSAKFLRCVLYRERMGVAAAVGLCTKMHVNAQRSNLAEEKQQKLT